jgi:all-trans-retinol dehydrogenase (NAD+)
MASSSHFERSTPRSVLGVLLAPFILVGAIVHYVGLLLFFVAAYVSALGWWLWAPVSRLLSKQVKIDGLAVVITGGNDGIGKDLAILLAARGAHVVIWARREKQLAQVGEEIRKQGGKCDWVCCDISTEENVLAAAATSRKLLGRAPNVVVGNAGVFFSKPFEQHTPSIIRRTMDVNFLANVWLTKAFLPDMKENGFGYFVFTSSVASFSPAPNVTLYTASKAALSAFAMSQNCENTGMGNGDVRFGVYCPGFVKTDMIGGLKPTLTMRLLLPLLTSKHCARTLEGMIRRRAGKVTEPFVWQITNLLQGTTFLPDALFNLSSTMLGIKKYSDGSMDVGEKPEKILASVETMA